MWSFLFKTNTELQNQTVYRFLSVQLTTATLPPANSPRPHPDTTGHPRPSRPNQDPPQRSKYSKNSQKRKLSHLGFSGTANTLHGSKLSYGHFFVHFHGHESNKFFFSRFKIEKYFSLVCLFVVLVNSYLSDKKRCQINKASSSFQQKRENEFARPALLRNPQPISAPRS